MSILNKAINNLPFELHIPGYRYCGPGTKLQKRLTRGDPGINPLDNLCKEHDIAYSQSRDNLPKRHEADKNLASGAWKRVLSRDAGLGERAAAWAVANTMNAKVKLGMGAKQRRKRRVGRGIPFKKLVAKVNAAVKKAKPKTLLSAAKIAVAAAKKSSGGKTMKPRVIPIKSGGILPLLPIFAGLSAIGALTGGAATVARTVKEVENAKKNLSEATRHNRTMEAIAIGKGMFLKPYKQGYGLYLKSPPSKN